MMGECIITRRGGGTDTSDATALSRDILCGMTTYDANGEKITGTIQYFTQDVSIPSDSDRTTTTITGKIAFVCWKDRNVMGVWYRNDVGTYTEALSTTYCRIGTMSYNALQNTTTITWTSYNTAGHLATMYGMKGI